MYIIVAGPGMGFPNGYAPTSRANLYARGLYLAGGRVLILCLGPSEYPEIGILNREAKGDNDGVAFEYTCGTPIRGNSFWQQKWLVLKGLLVAAGRILSLNKSNSVEAILLYSDRWVAILLFWFIAKLCRTKYIFESCEQPFYQAEHSSFWRAVSFIYTHTLFRLFDGALVISDYLGDYMRKRMRSKTRLLKIPILVDVDRLSTVQPSCPISGRFLAYCGSLDEAKDGVSFLMKSFAEIQTKITDLKLVLIGDSTKVSVIPSYRAIAEKLAISDKVVFTGLLTSKDMIPYLNQATILVLARPLSRQSEAGFPTKLGEYLSTGKPVLVTKTGEIANYLQDNVNVFLTSPGDVDGLVERLCYILSHPEDAAVIGRRGREAALQYFDYKENGKRLKAFIDQLGQDN